MANLKLQGSTYHARLTIPKDVRSKFGNKSELWGTTGTGDKRRAAIIGAEMVAAWKREVYAARHDINLREWSKDWAKELRQTSTKPSGDRLPSERHVVENILIDQLEDMVQGRQITLPEAKAAFEVAMGLRVGPLSHRMASGLPRNSMIRSSERITRSDGSEKLTSIPSASRL